MTVSPCSRSPFACRISVRLGAEFYKLWTASAVSNIGDGVTMAAAPLLVASLTTDPALVAGAVFVQQLPWLLFALISGAYVDQVDRRQLTTRPRWRRRRLASRGPVCPNPGHHRTVLGSRGSNGHHRCGRMASAPRSIRQLALRWGSAWHPCQAEPPPGTRRHRLRARLPRATRLRARLPPPPVSAPGYHAPPSRTSEAETSPRPRTTPTQSREIGRVCHSPQKAEE
jgi:hypothetical protein